MGLASLRKRPERIERWWQATLCGSGSGPSASSSSPSTVAVEQLVVGEVDKLLAQC